MKKVFKERKKITLNSTKSMIGHALGAAGALEAVAVVLQIVNEKVHPTINLENPEPDLEFDIPVAAKPLKITAALSNSFGFGGHNASIIIAPYIVV